jgi:hypothetical protein
LAELLGSIDEDRGSLGGLRASVSTQLASLVSDRGERFALLATVDG